MKATILSNLDMNPFVAIIEGGGIPYSAPAIEVLDIAVEQGFAASGDFGEEGKAGGEVQWAEYGEEL